MHVKITDFGVSQIVKRDLTENSEDFVQKKYFRGDVGSRGYQAPEVSSSSYTYDGQMGTYNFTPPEHFGDQLQEINDFYTAEADTYCFAMTCYEILSGGVPFKNVRRADIPELVLRGARPRLPRTVDRRLKRLIKQCWHRTPFKRPSFTEIRSSLHSFAAEVHWWKKAFIC